MATKTFKIGERCIGGIIKVTTNKTTASIIVLDYFTKKVVWEERTFELKNVNSDDDFYNSLTLENNMWKLDCHLNNMTTAYYADKVLTWIKTSMKIDRKHTF